MYPNISGGPGGASQPYPPYPQQQNSSPYNYGASGAHPQQQQGQFGGVGAGGYPYPSAMSQQPPPYPSAPPASGGYPGSQQQQPFGGAFGGQQPGAGYPPSGGQSAGYPNQHQSGTGGYPPSSGYPGQQQGGYPSQSQYPPGGPSQAPPPRGGNPYEQPYGGGQQGAMGGGGSMNQDMRMQKLNQLVQQYEINQQFASRLRALEGCEIVLLCDDSGSMNTPLENSSQTRWDEMKTLVNIIVDICAVMDSNGIDVYFLNRRPQLNVTDTRMVHQEFNNRPQGLTPLTPTIRQILQAKRGQAPDKKLLILVATDGAPTNERGEVDIASLEAVLRNERTPQTFVTFLACTDDLQAVNYLSNWDRTLPNLDVVDDYRSEKAEIQRTRGPTFPFSFGDYIVKSLLGAIDPWFDSLDEGNTQRR